MTRRGQGQGDRPGSGDEWLRDATDPAEATVRRALDEAATRLPDELTIRRVWAQLGTTGLSTPVVARRRPGWGLIAGALALAGTAVAAVVIVAPWADRVASHPPAVAGGEPVAPSEARSGTGAAGPTSAFLRAPAVVRTGAGERLRVNLEGGAEVELDPESTVDLARDGRRTVERGRVTLQVPKQAPGHRFEVSAGPHRIVVVGTVFSVEVARRQVAVEVREGLVEVWTGPRVVRLGPGQLWTAGMRVPPGAASPPVVPRSSVRPSGRRIAGRDEVPDGRATGHAWASRGSSATSSPPEAAWPSDRPTVGEGSPAAAPPDPVRQARDAIAAGKPERAAELLRRAARLGGPVGENAAYELGRVLRDQLLRPRDAVDVWRDYRARHPAGLLRAEVDLSTLETLVKLGEHQEAAEAARAFLAAYPRSERRREVESLLHRLRPAGAP